MQVLSPAAALNLILLGPVFIPVSVLRKGPSLDLSLETRLPGFACIDSLVAWDSWWPLAWSIALLLSL